jgi:subtilisin family serine protease
MKLVRISHKGIIKKELFIKITVLFYIFFTLLFPSRANADSLNYINGEILIKYSDNATLPEISDFEKLHNLTIIKIYSKFRFRHYTLPENIDVSKALKLFSSHDIIVHVEPNYTRIANNLLNDPDFPVQWSLNNTGQIVNGKKGAIDADIDWLEARDVYSGGHKVIIAVIDSGVAADHPEIFQKIWWNSGELIEGKLESNGIDDDGNGYIDDLWGWDFYDGDNLPFDENGHGTLVSSIIAGVEDNSEGGVGVTQDAIIMPLRIFNDWGRGSVIRVTDFSNALEYALNNGAEIVNCSFGGSGYSLLEYLWIEELKRNGVILVAASGNGGYDGRGDNNDIMPYYPAAYNLNNIVSVASTNEKDELSYFSNYGATSVDIAAPGENIFGADITRNWKWGESFENGGIGWLEGENINNMSQYSWSLYSDNFSNTWITDSVNAVGIATNYMSFTNTFALSPPIFLGIGSQLHYRIWYSLNFLDYLLVEVSPDNTNWEFVDIVFGYSYEASLRRLDISKYDLQTINIRFSLITDFQYESDGIYIDDVWISEVELFNYDGTQYDYSNGTSFAAPIVSGILALMKSERPDLDYLTIINLMLNNSDSLDTLKGMVAFGGRVNAYSSLIAVASYSSGNTDGNVPPSGGVSGSRGGGGGCFVSTINN